MNVAKVRFTDNAGHDLADIQLFQTFEQEIPEKISVGITLSIRKKTNFLLTNAPNAGKPYGYQGDDKVRTVVMLKKYMVFYHYNKTPYLFYMYFAR